MTMRLFAITSFLAIAGVLALAAAALATEVEAGPPPVNQLRDWASFIAVALSIITVIYTWFTAGSSANAETLAAHSRRLDAHGERLTRLEGDVAHLPPKDDVAELRVTIANLEGTIKALDAHLSGISRTVSRMDGYLRKERDHEL